MAHIFRKGGIPALASRLFDDLSPCLCSLIVKVDDAHTQATIMLEFKLPSKDPENDQIVSLVYDADNLVYGTTTLRKASPFPPRWGEITRNGGSDLKTLSFVSRDPCPVLCPVAFNRNDADPRFQQLEDLAKATRICVVFDYAWLHPNKSAQFSCLVGRSRLAGVPRKNTSALIREADWTALTAQSNDLTELEAPEAPPPYADGSKKRSRRSGGSLESPDAKRFFTNAATVEPFSPTEKATTATASPSPRHTPVSPLPTYGTMIIQDAVENAVAKLLPRTLEAMLPDMLTRMLAVPMSSPSPGVSPSPPNPMSPLHKLIRNRITAYTENLASEITTTALDYATDLREQADLELEERLDDHRREIALVKDDEYMEMSRMCDAKFDEFKEQATEVIQSVEAETEETYLAARAKLDDLLGEQRAALVKELLRIDLRRNQIAGAMQRARSLPLEAGW